MALEKVKEYNNSEIHDWVKNNSDYGIDAQVSELKVWLKRNDSNKHEQMPNVTWVQFRTAVAALGSYYGIKEDDCLVYECDGTKRRLRKLIKMTMQVDEQVSKLDPSTDMKAWATEAQDKYEFISTFGLTKMLTVLGSKEARR